MKSFFLLLISFFCLSLGLGQVTTIDFETAGVGYTSSGTTGSGFTDVFNRSNPNIGGNSSFIWSVEDLPLTNPSITLDQIDITGATDFTFSIDMLAHHFNDWDDDDELLITYSIDGGTYQNLMWVQNAGGTFNEAASLDTNFDGHGDCGTGVLPALSTGNSGCNVTSNTFATFVTSPITLSGNSTLDIELQFNGLDATDEGIYIDNIVITETSGTPAFTVSFDANGGSGTMADQTSNVAANLNANTFTYTGFVFTGWNTAANGSGVAYADEASYNFSADVTLYAQWNSIPLITNIIQSPSIVTPADVVTITAEVSDPDGLFEVELNWGTTSGSLINNINMTNTSGDIYSGNIPAQTAGTTIYYEIYAIDNNADDNVSAEQSYFVNAVCATPSIQASALTFPNTTASSIDVSFTGAGADNYLVVQSTSATLSSTPVDATVYSVSDALGGGTVVYNSNGTAFTASGLSQSTQYYYFVFAYNDAACSGGPKYLVPALSGDETTISGPCLSEDFTNLSLSSYFSGSFNLNGETWEGTEIFQETSGNSFGGTGKAVRINDDIVDANLTSPSLSAPQSISFKYRELNSGGGTFKIQKSIAGGAFTDVCTSTFSGTNYQVYNCAINETNNDVRIRILNDDNPGHLLIDDIEIFCGSPTPEIEVQGNSNEIVSGDVTPSATDGTDFGTVTVLGTNTVLKTFTIINTGGSNLNLTGTSPYVSISGTNAADFTLTANPSTPIIGGGQTSFEVTFDPSAVGTRTATISIANDDSDEDPYTFAIKGIGVNSNASDIITSPGFVYQSNIDYTAYQEVGPLNSTSNNIALFSFDIRDGAGTADADALGTELKEITFDLGATHIQYIRAAALFDGNTMRANNPVIDNAAGTITFTSLSGSDFTAADDASLTLSLRISFESTVLDNEQIQCTISNVLADSTGSIFATNNGGGAVSSSNGDDNRLEVIADRLSFGQQPTNTNSNLSMSPAVTVEAIDVNSNIDLDFSANINVTSTGTLSGTTVTESALNGVANFSSLIHTVDGTSFTLSANSTGLIGATSSTFDILAFTLITGDFRPQFSTDFTANGSWEYYDGTAWISTAGSGWDGSAPQNTSTTINRILIDKYTTAGSNSSTSYDCDIIIQSGGVLELLDNDPTPAAEFLLAGNTLEVEQGGELIVRGDIDLSATANLIVRSGGTITIDQNSINNAHPMWDGIENFEGNSSLVINDWDWTASPIQRSLVNNLTNISDNSNGYKFGEIILEANPAEDWTFVGGPLNIDLAENDVSISNASTNNVQMMTNATPGVSTRIGGSLNVLNGDFSFSGSYNSNDFNHSTTILGDLEVLSTGGFYLHRNNLNTPNTANSQVHVAGNVIINGPTSFTSDQASSSSSYNLHLNGGGSSTQLLNVSPAVSNVHFIVDPSASVELVENSLRFADNAQFEVESGATFNFGFDALNNALFINQIAGTNNQFTLNSGAYLYITSPDGLDQTNSTDGNVRNIPISNRSIAQTNSTFHYTGKTNQETGDFHSVGSTSKTIIVELENDNDNLTLTNSTGTSTLLDIRSGVFVETETANISGGGDLTMTGGGFKTAVLSSTGAVPQLTGSYTLTGGFIEINATGDQELRGSRDYFDLRISGSNTQGVDDKTVTSAFTIANQLTLTGTPIFDIENKGMTGNAGISMDGGLLRMSKITTLPELDGLSTSYNLSGGTIELYGTSATQTQGLRGTDGNGNNISYHNVEINADATNLDFIGSLGNISPTASIELTGTLNVNSPASFRLDLTNSISGSGNIDINDGSTLFYSSPEGIKTSGTTTSDGHIRVTGSRSLSSNASYGFIGTQTMVSGDALPSEVLNLYVAKNSGLIAELSSSVEVKNELQLLGGVLKTTGTDEVYVSSSANSAIVGGATSGNDKFIEGRLRWATDNNAYTFPIGYSPGGVQEFTIEATGSGDILGYLETRTSTLVENYAYCDIETSTSPGQQIGQGIAGQDGVLDQITFDLFTPLQWTITNPGGGVSSYDITVQPDASQDITPVNAADGTPIRYLMKNGEPGNTGIATGNTPDFPQTGFLECPTAYSLSGLTSFSEFILVGSSGSSTALPVELVDFTAKVIDENRMVLLEWVTASEINNDYFTLEKSHNGYDWTVLATVEGSGNSTSSIHYNYEDRQPFQGISYYRLKQTDFDGNSEYFNIRSVELGGSGKELLYRVNTLGQKVDETFKGMVLLHYSDGSTVKIIQR
jgi:uncharacterized repeat protein (TIGR02543 family)